MKERSGTERTKEIKKNERKVREDEWQVRKDERDQKEVKKGQQERKNLKESKKDHDVGYGRTFRKIVQKESKKSDGKLRLE